MKYIKLKENFKIFFENILSYSWSVSKWIVNIVLVIGCFVFVKMFIGDVYNVPSKSMEGSILDGDYIIANKLYYGPKWPQSPMEIPWFNLLSLSDCLTPWFKNTHWSYKRWPSKTDQIERDDILVFEGPWGNRIIFVKRCKGLPGDLIQLKFDQLIVNNVAAKEPETVRYIYNSSRSLSNFKGIGDFENDLIFFGSKKFQYKLHPEVAKKINGKIGAETLSVSPYLQTKDNNYGPIIVPAKGLTINLNHYKHVLSVYIGVIKVFEKSTIQMSESIILVDGKPDSLYTFKYDYYFMMGDNRHSSHDSRRWGFIPEQNIIGKATSVGFSQDHADGKIRWDRIFKTVK